jgi:hypothetical protein
MDRAQDASSDVDWNMPENIMPYTILGSLDFDRFREIPYPSRYGTTLFIKENLI